MSLALLCFPENAKPHTKEERVLQLAELLRRHRGTIQRQLVLPPSLRQRQRIKRT